MNKEVKRHIMSIVEVLVFLIVVTVYWFGPREALTANIMANISDYQMNKKISVITDKELTFGKETNFTVTNKTNIEQNYEIIIMSDYKRIRKNKCNALENNYLKYKLNDYEEKNLSVEGIIYTGVLQPNEKKNFSIKIDLDNNSLDNTCYYPTIKVSTFYKI